jgi:hypothetical protein
MSVELSVPNELRLRLQEDIFRLEITMDQSCVLQYAERIQQLLCKDSNKTGRETAECVLLNEFV